MRNRCSVKENKELEQNKTISMDFIVFTSKLFSAQEEETETETEDSDDSMIKLIIKQTTKIKSPPRCCRWVSIVFYITRRYGNLWCTWSIFTPNYSNTITYTLSESTDRPTKLTSQWIRRFRFKSLRRLVYNFSPSSLKLSFRKNNSEL